MGKRGCGAKEGEDDRCEYECLLCAKSGRFQHLNALIFGEELSLHSHAIEQKSSRVF